MAVATITFTLDDDEYSHLVHALKEYEQQYRDRAVQDMRLGIEDDRIRKSADALAGLIRKIQDAVGAT